MEISFPQHRYDYSNCIIAGASSLYSKLDEGVSRLSQHSFGMTKFLHSVIKVQRWWRFLRSQNLKRKSAVLIQSHTRGLFARRRTSVERHNIVMIQVSYDESYFFSFCNWLAFFLVKILKFHLPCNLSVTLERLSHTQSLKGSSSWIKNKNANLCSKHRWQETIDKQASFCAFGITEHEKGPQHSSHLRNFGWVSLSFLYLQNHVNRL